MNIDKGKCEFSNFGASRTVKFRAGTILRTSNEVKYLGYRLNDRADAAQEVQKCIAECTTVLKKLDLVGGHANCSSKAKSQVFDAVIRSKLMYSLSRLPTMRAAPASLTLNQYCPCPCCNYLGPLDQFRALWRGDLGRLPIRRITFVPHPYDPAGGPRRHTGIDAEIYGTPGEAEGNSDDECQCPICLSQLERGGLVVTTPCGHVFHARCFEQWASRSWTCAVCRESMARDDAGLPVLPPEPPDAHEQNVHQLQQVLGCCYVVLGELSLGNTRQ